MPPKATGAGNCSTTSLVCPPVQAVVLPGGYFVQQGEPNRYLDLSFNVDDFATNGRLVKIGVGDDEVCVRLFDFGNG